MFEIQYDFLSLKKENIFILVYFMKISLFKIIPKVFFDHLDSINKNALLNENVIKKYILLVMFYVLLNYNLQYVIILGHERVKN